MNLQQNWTIAKIMKETYDFGWMKLSGWLRKPGSYELERNDMFMNVKKYIRDEFVCYRIFHADFLKDTKHYHIKSHHNTYGPEPGGSCPFLWIKRN